MAREKLSGGRVALAGPRSAQRSREGQKYGYICIVQPQWGTSAWGRPIPGSRDQQVAVLLGKQTLPVE